MSGIAGILNRSGEAVREEQVSAMMSTLVHRGPDTCGVWTHGNVGFGHRMLWTTPESLNEKLPLTHTSSGCSITADARIDNRGELIGKLGLRRPAAELSDSELILAAYEEWGDSCVGQLIGDFVFAIWDDRKHQLFCARDPMGVKCLYYFESPGMFAFGSEIKALTALPEVPRRLNEVRVLDFLVNVFDDRASTFYRDIVRLPAASSLTVNRERLRLERYWSLDPQRELTLSSDEEYTEAFREVFQESIRCRLRSAYPVGAAVSGGLDSSSIACVARQLQTAGGQPPIHTYSLIFPDLPAEDLHHIDERKFIDCVLKQGGFQPHFVRADQLSPLTQVDRVLYHLDEAFFSGNLYLHWAMYGAAQQSNVRVFLDGFDGDTTVSHGFEALSDLLLRFRWKTLSRELNLLSANLGRARSRLFRDFCVKPLCPTWVYTLRNMLRGQFHDGRTTSNLLREDFKERLGLAARVNSMLATSRHLTASAREKHWEMLNAALYPHALEIADKASAAFSLEGRYPFFDRRLIELCLSLPANQKLGQGWPRLILRKAMEGILPAEIQYRPGKGNLSPNFYRRLLAGDRKLLDEVVLQGAPALQPYIDPQAMRQAYSRYGSDPRRHHNDSVQLFEAVNLALWLDHSGLAP